MPKEPTTTVIREARPGDVPGVLALWDVARSDHARTADTADALERLLVDRPGALLVAVEDDRVLGALIATWDGWRGNMYRLAVRPTHRRRGIARELVREGEKRLRERGITRVTALVAREDAPATGLWEAAGYPYDAVIGRFVRDLH
jgi:ribosomal protein S18 acetylase RimI-like enzyme